MYKIVTILGIIYLLYRIRFFYKEGNYNQVKSLFYINFHNNSFGFETII